MDQLSLVPDLLDALIDKARAVADGPDDQHPLYGRYVEDGYGTSNGGYGDTLMVGVEDPKTVDAYSAETDSDYAYVGSVTRTEKGYVTCLAMSTDGAANQKAARDAAYQTARGVAQLCNADTSLGLDGLQWVVVGKKTRLSQGQDDRGAVALLTFRIYFEGQV